MRILQCYKILISFLIDDLMFFSDRSLLEGKYQNDKKKKENISEQNNFHSMLYYVI